METSTSSLTPARPPGRRQRRDLVRAQWIATRARNALQRPMRIGAFAAPVFVAALVLMILVPRRAPRVAPVAPARPRVAVLDTAPYLDAEHRAQLAFTAADSVLTARRARNARRATAVPILDTVPPAVAARRDSITSVVTQLDQLIGRAANAPLPSSYRALGESAALRDDGRVRVLLDSLTDIEREREDAGTVGGVDPIFVALTSRANALGRAIQAIAEDRRNAMRGELVALAPAAPVVPVFAVADTIGALARRDSAQAVLRAATQALAGVRQNNAEADKQAATARAQANIAIPPTAMLAAALVIAVALGFAIVFGHELRRPRVGDPNEIERVTWSRVLAVVRPRPIPPERSRREADRNLPPLLDPAGDAYRSLAASLALTADSASVITVTGDSATVAAAIAANLAAVAANDSRSTLLIDADFRTCVVAALLRVPPAPGVADVLRRTIQWTEVIQQVVVGRDRVLDVMPSGTARREAPSEHELEAIGEAVTRLSRRYDLIVIAAPEAFAGQLRAAPDTVVCASVHRTPISSLLRAVTSLREQGARIAGLVLWDAEEPQMPSRAERAALATPRAASATPDRGLVTTRG